ncbi:substrate-binding domain-containing protein [Georgenia sp. AZ-5]|uniref:substrate-binding domain-containing protein n=1 Tax=Georgenia sp. AZ-5 TaxID=3367526 RepID=UPI003753F255
MLIQQHRKAERPVSKNRRRRAHLAVATVAALLAACAGGGDGDGGGEAGGGAGGEGPAGDAETLERQELPEWLTLPDIESLETRGNVGEEPTWYNDVSLTDDQVAEVRDRGLKAAFLNWSSGAYNQAVLAGAEDALDALGIEMVAVTNYNFDQATLQTDVRNVMALDPDIIFYSGVDPTADVAALQPAVDAGTAIVSFANAPGGWTTGEPENFVTLVSYDTHGNGAAVARAVADRFPDGANLGMIFFDRTYKLVNEREQGFRDAIAQTNVELVTEQPMSDPARTQPIASAMLTRYPDLDVIFAPWDLPAEGVLAGIQGAEKEVAVAHIDLGFTGAQHIACGGPIFVMSSQLVYEWGRTGAIAAALHALGEDVPPYIVVPVFAVTEDNLEEGWNLAYGGVVPLPGEAQSCLDGEG